MKSAPLQARRHGVPGGEAALQSVDSGSAQPAPETAVIESRLEPNGAEQPCEGRRTESDREADREDFGELIRWGDTGIEVAPCGAGIFAARFAVQLASVSSVALAPDQTQWNKSAAIAPSEAARQRALGSLASCLRPHQCVRFVHETFHLGDHALRYRMRVEGETRGCSAASATSLARELLDSLRACLAVGAEHFGFVGLERPLAPVRWRDRVGLIPAAIAVTPPAGVAMGATAAAARPCVMLPIVPRHGQTSLDGIISTLTSLRAPAQLVIEWQGLPDDHHLYSAIEREVASLLDLSASSVRYDRQDGQGAEVQAEDVRLTHRALQGWLTERLGALMAVRLHSASPLAPSVGRMLGREIFLGRPFALRAATEVEDRCGAAGNSVIDLRGLVTFGIALPPLLPNPVSADAHGFARQFPVVDFDRPRKGIVLGQCARRGLEIRFADRDRGQHCLVLGQTGSGKTRGVIEAMALQDMARGDGIVHIDFDGDSFDYLHAACPPERRSDIVSLDFTDFEASPGLNLFQFQTRWPRIERGFIVDNLVQLFKYQYPNTPEAFGPIFEMYLTNAVYLAMEEPGSTVADIVRVFSESAYRRRLLKMCTDPRVVAFWQEIALRTGGESSLENIAPYIVCKLTKLVDQELVRRVVAQSKSTIDFRAGMDARRIFLIKLSKGLLSEGGARFLGMLLTCQLFAAALSRADSLPEDRTPCHVYLDEFQNLVSPAIEGMLAESRKFGLRLTLSNQNLAQLPETLAQSVLTNCGTKIILRSGPQDATLLAPWVKPHFTDTDLISLPNRHAVVRVVADGVLSPPFAMRTSTQAKRELTSETEAWVRSIKAESKSRYCVDAQTIDARIAARCAEPKAPLPTAPIGPATNSSISR